MAVSLTPHPPYVCLMVSSSPSGFVPTNPDVDEFGSIYKINIYSIGLNVNDIVLFDKTKATFVSLNNDTYILVDESNIKFTDTGVAP